ncbi:site-specific DNA-methyltransferase, partial [Magnetococcales bacterium HHB-1]
MRKLTLDDPELKSADLIKRNIEQMKELFPEAVSEGKIDFEVLKQLLGDDIDDQEERYGLNWYGKSRARQIALTSSTGTLRPCLEESVDWDATQNLMIEGDNLEVLKLLQKSYSNEVKMIYIDPPYNTGKDFVYPDNFHDGLEHYLEITKQTDDHGLRISSNREASGRFHTDWMNMIYPRLRLARNFLRDDGILFVSIDEREYSNLRMICCEIFGEENIIGTIIWKNATDNNPTNIATEHEYILVVAKGKEAIEKQWKTASSDIKDILVKIGQELIAQYSGDELIKAYQAWFRKHKMELGPLDRYKYIDSGGVYTGSQSVHNPGREGYRYDILHPETKKPCKQPLMGYRFPEETMDDLLEKGRILFGKDESKIVELKVYAADYKEKLSSVFTLDGRLGAYDLKADFPVEGKVFSNPKPVRLLQTFFSFLLKEDNDIVLDFFAGSGVTAKAIFESNAKDAIARRFILIQLPESLDLKNKEHQFATSYCSEHNLKPA